MPYIARDDPAKGVERRGWAAGGALLQLPVAQREAWCFGTTRLSSRDSGGNFTCPKAISQARRRGGGGKLLGWGERS
jgi:hypothetical protein